MTAERRHTPGPWKLLEVGDNNWCPADQNNHSILTLTEEDGVTFATVYSAADARLIAAAPEMLAALEAAEALYKVGLLAAASGQSESVVTLRRAAIAKAVQA